MGELVCLLGIVGLLATVAVPATTRQVHEGQTAEAFESLMRIATGAAVYYHVHPVRMAGDLRHQQFPDGEAWSPQKQCCTYEGKVCPASADTWRRGPSSASWSALGFSLPGDHRYRYTYGSAGSDCDAGFWAFAEGDLDCDGTFSLWRIHGTTANEHCTVHITPVFAVEGGAVGPHKHEGPHGGELE